MPRSFWAAPLRQLVFDNRREVLVCITQGKFPLPGKCCCCGSSHTKLHFLKIKPTGNDAAVEKPIELVAGHVTSGINYLVRRKLEIPCCSSCRLLRWIGYALAFTLSSLGLIPFIRICMMDQAIKLHTTLSAELGAVIAMFLLPALGVGIAAWCSWHSLPVLIYGMTDGRLYFEFWSPPYQKLLINACPPNKAAA